MRIYGIDFTSDPKDGKPLTKAVCQMEGAVLSVDSLGAMCSYQGLALLLAEQGQWIAGIDFPFGQPRQLVIDLKWPQTWGGYVRRIAEYSKMRYAKLINEYRAGQPDGQKEHFRAVDGKAGSLSPMKMYGVPVGKMFHQGSPFLLASPCQIVPFLSEARPTVVVEAYPGLVARKFVGRRSYKNDDRERQTADHGKVRKALVRAITSAHSTSGSNGMSGCYGFHVEMAAGLASACIEDPSGDKLDAILAAIQAAWAYSRRDDNYGVPSHCDLLEGWIPDPQTYTA
jgi:Protein of unknown function (DUF429)